MSRKVLFLCTGNAARSQMGEAIMRKYADDAFDVYSAGIEPADEIFPPVIKVMKEIGIDLSDQKPKSIREYLGQIRFERVFIVCANAEKRCPTIFGLSEREFWPLPDPSTATGTTGEVEMVCRNVRDELDRRIKIWLSENKYKDHSLQ